MKHKKPITKLQRRTQPKQRSSSQLDIGHILRMVFIPGRHNNYRPQLVRSWVLVLVVLGFVAGQFSAGLFGGANSVLGDADSMPPSMLLKDTNAARQAAGVQPLHLNMHLTDAAAAKAKDMFTYQYWNHVSPSGVQPWHWIAQTGYMYQAAGENLAKNFYTPDATVQAWYDSPVHRENMLNGRYSDVGFASVSGLLDGERATITVAMYGEPLVSSVTVASAQMSPDLPGTSFMSAGVDVELSFADRVGLALRSMPPLVIGVLVLMILSLIVLLMAHAARRDLPRSHIRKHWRYNHALIKGVGVFIFVVAIFWMYSGGQI